jgi:hypothetical protein
MIQDEGIILTNHRTIQQTARSASPIPAVNATDTDTLPAVLYTPQWSAHEGAGPGVHPVR